MYQTFKPQQPINKTIKTCFIVTGVVMVLASINPLDWSSYLLHQVGTVVFMGVMLWCYRYWQVSVSSFVMATVFIIIHIIGAHYLYSYMPYNEWSQALFSVSINEVFGWQRNMYDRLVHFSYGLLLFGFMFDCFKATFKHSSLRQLIFLVLLFNLASSALYELFEWSLAMTMSANAAEAYNGQQGDAWDAHKDMALALLGSLISACFMVFQPANHLRLYHRHPLE